MIHLVAASGRPHPDRVGQDPLPGLVLPASHRPPVMATRSRPPVRDQRLKRLVRAVREEAVEGHVGIAVARGDERLSHRTRGRADERVVLGIGHGLEPRPETLAAGPGEGRVKPRAPAQLDDVPARGGEPRASCSPRVGTRGPGLCRFVSPIHRRLPTGERVLESASHTLPSSPASPAWRRSAAGAGRSRDRRDSAWRGR